MNLFGKEAHPGGAPGLQIRWETLDVSGGFDSHSFPPKGLYFQFIRIE